MPYLLEWKYASDPKELSIIPLIAGPVRLLSDGPELAQPGLLSVDESDWTDQVRLWNKSYGPSKSKPWSTSLFPDGATLYIESSRTMYELGAQLASHIGAVEEHEEIMDNLKQMDRDEPFVLHWDWSN